MSNNLNESRITFSGRSMAEDIVISGISGRFPESDSMDELKYNLYNGLDMITEDERRWPLGLYGLPTRSGKIKDLGKFDAQFFGVNGKQANKMDPQLRLLLEVTYEAIIDSGINPETIRGSQTGVFIGAFLTEAEESLASEITEVTGYEATGAKRNMISNQVSYAFDLKGPSFTIDSACSSSFIALQQAFIGLNSGQCDRAIVGGVNICLKPANALQFQRLGILSIDGKSKFLDSSANGYVRSETCSAILLQRKSEAKRIYATIVNTRTNSDGYKEQGITYPSWELQKGLMRSTLLEAGINPLDVKYIEAHGTGTPTGDQNESKSIFDVYCENRAEPLLIGSVKSNLGHTEPASGLCSIAKVLIMFENQSIPPILHFKIPNPNIPALLSGHLKPVIENTPFVDSIVGINSFGFGGSNVHVLLKPHPKELTQESLHIIDDIPRLIPICGRTEESVKHIINFIEENPEKVTNDLLALLYAISQTSESSGMKYRGYVLVTNNDETIAVHKKQIIRVPEKRPVWFVFPGMGSQWKAMLKGMTKLKTFMESIKKSAHFLNPYGIDLIDLLMSEDDRALEPIIASSVAIAAVQIALVDVLRELGVEPDGIVGHSSGELGCGYADGVLNAEQMILSAYWRGKCIERSSLPKGLMAAIGLTWEETKRRCPEGVVAACHNALESVTISGDYDVTQEFLQVLRSEKVFVREVKSCEIAFHSHHIQVVAPDLLQELNKVIPNPLPRSNRWISSSVPEDEWSEDYAKWSSAAYQVNNLTSPVLFHEAVQYIPQNAIVIEIAPHSLFEPILKQSLGSNISYFSLMKRNNNSENLDLLLSSVVKLYILGLNPKVDKLYPKFEFPVSRGTQSISSLIKWDHSENWSVTLYPEYFNSNASNDYTIKIDINSKEYAFLADHCIDGRILFPATGYLMLVWQMLAKNMGLSYEQISIEFEDVKISRGTILSKESQTKFIIQILETTGEFSISEGGTIAVTGRVRSPDQTKLIYKRLLNDGSISVDNGLRLDTRHVYKELRIRGYDYGSEFQNIIESDGSRGSVRYRNWITFTDSMLHMKLVAKYSQDLYLPISIQTLRCDPIILAKAIDQSLDKVLNAVYNPLMDVWVADGLEIHGIGLNLAPRRSQMPTIEKFKFIPYFEENALEENDRLFLNEYINVCSHLSRQVMKSFDKPFKEINGFNELDDNNYDLNEDYMSSTSEEYIILKALKELMTFDENELFKENIKNFHNKYETELEKDIVNNVYTRLQLIRPALDVVIENLSSYELNILEINSNPNIVYHKVLSIIESNLRKLNVKYNLSKSSSDVLNEKTDIEGLKLIGRDFPNVNISKIERTESILDLIIYKASHVNKVCDLNLEDIYFVTKNNGFVIALIRTDLTPAEHLLYKLRDIDIVKTNSNDFISKALKIGFSLVSVRTDSMTSSVILLRKTVPTKLSQQSFVEIKSTDYSWVEKLKSKLIEHESKPNGENIWLIGDDLRTNGVVGLVNCLGREPGGHRIRCILSQLNDNQSVLTSDVIKQSIYCDAFNNDLVMNVYRDGEFGSFRHLDIDFNKHKTYIKTKHAFLNQTKRGDTSSFQWFTSYNGLHDKQNENICDIYYSSLNSNDIALATGKASFDNFTTDKSVSDSIFGSEFTGRDQNGNRIMGIIPSKCLATSVAVNNTEYLWSIPQNWTMEEAITVPVSYSKAFYALIVRGDLKAGETVLIHAGSGGAEEAAISICLYMKCNVYITVGSKITIDLLKTQFPELNEQNFVNSLENSFEHYMIEKTNGSGVDVFLNSSSVDSHSLQASIRCLAQNGRFLELSKAELMLNHSIKKQIYSKNISIHCIDSEDVLDSSLNQTAISVFQRQEIHKLINDGIKSGSVRPLSRTVFPVNQIEEAFNYRSSDQHFGKVVVKIRGEEPFHSINSQKFEVNAITKIAFHPQKSYIIIGGLGGFGLELANWLIERGARKLVLTSRSGPRDTYQHLCIERFHSFGAEVIVLKSNSNTIEDLTRLITESLSLGPVGGIFNLAMVLSDALFENQSQKTFEDVCSSKIDITLNLDSISRQLCPQLDYFVVFSSVSSGRGNAGQSNYGFGNSSMERICEFRRKDGLHGLAIQWGAVADVGVVAETVVDSETVVGGTVPQRIQSCISLMDDFLKSNESVVCSLVKPQIQYKSVNTKNDLVESIANILGIRDHERLNDKTLLSELGIDSLMGIEIKQTLERDYGINISIQEMRSLNIKNLIEMRAQIHK